MKKVYLELTNRCNLNCIMCYRKSWHETMQDMDKVLLRKCLEEIKTTGSIESVVLGGIGEPTFSEDILYAIKALRDKHITVTSNGTLMSQDLVNHYVNYVDELIISIDGLSESFYQIRKIHLEQILDNIGCLNKQIKASNTGPKIAFQMVITKDNYLEIPEIVKLASCHNVSKIIFSNIVPAVSEDTCLAMYKMYDKEPLKTILMKAMTLALARRIEVIVPEVMLKTERRCNFIEDEATMVTVEGYVVPCYRLAHDGKEVVFGREKTIQAHHFGHIGKQSLDGIWHSKDYTDYRLSVLNNQYPSCMDCDLVEGCDMAKNTDVDCFGNVPSCADCLWSRRIVQCV